MDADYARNQGGASAGFKHALFVLATVMSAARPGLAVVDAGLKAVSTDSGMPLVWGHERAQTTPVHPMSMASSRATCRASATRCDWCPSHCDPTVDRYDWYVGVRAGRVECLWPVAARGALH